MIMKRGCLGQEASAHEAGKLGTEGGCSWSGEAWDRRRVFMTWGSLGQEASVHEARKLGTGGECS